MGPGLPLGWTDASATVDPRVLDQLLLQEQASHSILIAHQTVAPAGFVDFPESGRNFSFYGGGRPGIGAAWAGLACFDHGRARRFSLLSLHLVVLVAVLLTSAKPQSVQAFLPHMFLFG